MSLNDIIDEDFTTERLPVLPLRGLVAFPEMLIHFDVGRLISMKALEAAMKGSQQIFLTAQCDIATDIPGSDDLFIIGTVCNIKQILRLPGDNIRVLVQGTSRAFADSFDESDEQCMYAEVVRFDTEPGRITQKRRDALLRTMQETFEEYAQLSSRVSKDVIMTVLDSDDPSYLADYITQNISVSYDVKQQVLEEVRDVHRAEFVIRLLLREIGILKIENDLQDKFKEAVDKNQREYYLREQLKPSFHHQNYN